MAAINVQRLTQKTWLEYYIMDITVTHCKKGSKTTESQCHALIVWVMHIAKYITQHPTNNSSAANIMIASYSLTSLLNWLNNLEIGSLNAPKYLLPYYITFVQVQREHEVIMRRKLSDHFIDSSST